MTVPALTGPPGPPYPPIPPGSSAIGRVVIGVTPVGTIPPFNVWDTIISQYANSPILTTLITNFFAYLDQTKNFDAFWDNIWNIDTAQGYGLDVWGRIVGINRTLTLTSPTWFGPKEGQWQPFNQAPFYSGVLVSSNFVLSDEAYRTLILAKALFNITDGSIPSINAMLMTLFPNRGGNAFVQEGAPPEPFFGFEEEHNAQGFNQAPFYNGQTFPTMVMSYVFNFPLHPVDLAIVNSGVLPKPVGVLANVVQIF